ncbi:hypothetical protein K2173_001397 [Erythroxylum novogranatense]|uniref:RING-type E3 ubiquitin transferase n=1 Tax=Erythroxylum novogranatense TaxID=1862640 RepID=A0AAV8T4P9_9ROSI|nr:hypothetical protein K2173_001397 [Erythroxylum novogranatense]
MEGHGEMVIFSVRGGEEEDDIRDESSSLWPKRQRATTSSTSSSQQRRQRPRHADPNPVYNFDSDYEEEETRQDEGEEEQRASVDDGSEEEEEGQNQVSTTELPSMSSLRSARSDSIAMTITLTDPEVLDCPICFEPFTIPVFQCENGHTACSSCCIKIAHKCPSCALPTGYNRCRAIEKVLESIRVNCRYTRYGCKESFSYDKKHNHDKTCIYAPCVCPQAGCNFVDSSKRLYEHYSRKHTSSRLGFNYNATFPIYVTTRDTFFVLQEENEGVLFLFYSKAEVLGHTIKICCLGPSTMNGRYIFELTARTEGSNLRFQSIAKNIRCRVDNHPSTGFLLIPIGFFDSYVQNRLDICIWRHGSCPVEFRTSIPKAPSGS